MQTYLNKIFLWEYIVLELYCMKCWFFRQRKLQETLLAVQQLDVSMSNLRKWLANMEDDLSAPVVYQDCERKEIQRKLQHQSVSDFQSFIYQWYKLYTLIFYDNL